MNQKFQALKVNQWLPEWEQVRFNDAERRKKPLPHFYILSIPAKTLMRLSNVYQRKAEGRRTEDASIQRKSSPQRVEEISRFIKGGFPWSDLTARQRELPKFQDLKMPGWLPTAIVVNILAPNTERLGHHLAESDSVGIESITDTLFEISIPKAAEDDEWNPMVKPIEVIDGQHRLLAFSQSDQDDNFEVPVVAFQDLDITWQAYLFYTVNIKPKRINTSLAFDLYPLLRVQEWLEKSSDAPAIYRETRAQELTETLWSHPDSIWRDRISMLGDETNKVSQGSFIRALINTYIKKWDSSTTGGLFGGAAQDRRGEVLAWTRSQQAAFLLRIWASFEKAVLDTEAEWAVSIRDASTQHHEGIYAANPAFWSPYSLISTDQGIRGFLQITNDIFYTSAQDLSLSAWQSDPALESEVIDLQYVSSLVSSIGETTFTEFIDELCRSLSNFDWRSATIPGLDNQIKAQQLGYKGSSGYREMRNRLTRFLLDSSSPRIADAASQLIQRTK